MIYCISGHICKSKLLSFQKINHVIDSSHIIVVVVTNRTWSADRFAAFTLITLYFKKINKLFNRYRILEA